jgi:hypothetical protein
MIQIWEGTLAGRSQVDKDPGGVTPYNRLMIDPSYPDRIKGELRREEG